jgi:hypothetical protein
VVHTCRNGARVSENVIQGRQVDLCARPVTEFTEVVGAPTAHPTCFQQRTSVSDSHHNLRNVGQTSYARGTLSYRRGAVAELAIPVLSPTLRTASLEDGASGSYPTGNGSSIRHDITGPWRGAVLAGAIAELIFEVAPPTTHSMRSGERTTILRPDGDGRHVPEYVI